ncbi:ScyD/ScyE family protein [Dyadobacter sp. 3J3]|uniref:ScyD/ScyE family protein n=1 Tax=Dyadobacter sp. 3J3 TaxID=2606600 RepID=UPI00135B8783|nr:ScyD/ScyE family protein [Dyadobacter sp. 3J3]
MKKSYFLFPVLVFLFSVQSCTDHDIDPTPEPQSLSSETIFSELKSPIGIAVDDKGNIWVTEAGTGNNNTDGSVSMITPSGNKTTFVTGLLSVTNAGEGSIEGISHLFYHDGKLYFLHGVNGTLYKADVSSFKSGDPAVNLADIPSEDVGTYIRSLALTSPLNSNAFDLTLGPEGHLYIVDAGSNAIIKKDKDTGKLSLFAHFPDAATKVDAVPTGIVYDGSKLLVSSLTGFPFTPSSAKIFEVDKDGTVNVYKDKFTTLTGITLSANGKPIVIQHGVFGAMGFGAKSGKVLDENGNILLDNVSRPTGIVRAGDRLFYLLSYTDGTISKLTY